MQLLKSGANIKESVSSNSPDTLLYLFSVYKRKWTFFHKCLSAVWIWPRHWIYIISIKPFTVPWWLGVLFFFLKKKLFLKSEATVLLWASAYRTTLSLCFHNRPLKEKVSLSSTLIGVWRVLLHDIVKLRILFSNWDLVSDCHECSAVTQRQLHSTPTFRKKKLRILLLWDKATFYQWSVLILGYSSVSIKFALTFWPCNHFNGEYWETG